MAEPVCGPAVRLRTGVTHLPCAAPPCADARQALLFENAVLARALAAAQQRGTEQAELHRRCCDRLHATVMRLRGELMARDVALAALRDELQALESEPPGAHRSAQQAREHRHRLERQQALQRALMQARHETPERPGGPPR